MCKMIMINRRQSVKASRGCYTFISSCIGVPAYPSERGDDYYNVKGVDIVRAYQLIAEPLPKLDALHCERDGNYDGCWSFHKSEVVIISD